MDNQSEVDSLEELPPPPVDDEVTEEEVTSSVQVESSSKVMQPDESIGTWKTKRAPSESPSRIAKKRAEENPPVRNKTATSSYSTSSRSSSSTVKSVSKNIRSPSGSSSIPRMTSSTLKKKGGDNPPEGTADESVADFVKLEREIEKESHVTNGSSPISKRSSLKSNIPSPSTSSNRKAFESSSKSSVTTTTTKVTQAEQRRPLRKVETRTASGG